MRIWSICAFDQTRGALGQLRKPNCNPSSKTKPNPNPKSLILNLTLIPLQVWCTIDQILRNLSNAAQLINWSAAQRIWWNAQLTKWAVYIANIEWAEYVEVTLIFDKNISCFKQMERQHSSIQTASVRSWSFNQCTRQMQDIRPLCPHLEYWKLLIS